MGEAAGVAIGSSFACYVHPADVHLCREFLERTLTTGKKQSSVQYRVRHRDGSWRWHVSNGSPLRDDHGTVTGYLGIARDVTDAKRSEEALREREALLSGILDNLQDAFFRADQSGRFTFVNPAAPLMFGYEATKAMIAVPAQELFAYAADYAALAHELQQRRAVRDWICLKRRADGSTFWASINAHLICAADGSTIGAEGVVRDVTERKLAEDGLREQLRIETLVAELAARFVGVAAQDAEQAIRDALQGICACLNLDMATLWEPPQGNPHSQVLKHIYRRDDGSPLPDVIDAQDYCPWILAQLRKTGATVAVTDVAALPPEAARDAETFTLFGITSSISVPLKEADGALAGLLVFATNAGQPVAKAMIGRIEMFAHIIFDLLVRVRSERALVASQRERQKLQAQLLQAQKMESIGRLAGGVAHDFNNLLTVIMGNVELCQLSFEHNHPSHYYLDQIATAAERTGNLVRQLLMFARKQAAELTVLDLNEQIAVILKMLRRLIGEHIELTWSPASNLRHVRADSSHIDQVIANLYVNAADAIVGSGRITIATRNISMSAEACAVLPGLRPGAYVLLSVADTGCGMDDETRARVFEPFFTTKEPGRGTGLGLTTVYGIVKQCNGCIDIDSLPGVGTTVRIYLPAVDNAQASLKAAPSAEPPGGNETILVVDDEQGVRIVVATQIERLGYSVLPAGGPDEAIRLARQHGGTIDLMLSDIVMPGMSGFDLRDCLLADYPRMKTILMTGYTEAERIEREDRQAHTLRLAKPIPIHDLATAIRSVLDGDRAEY
jgi:PAS domain S-box-containing protein